MARRCDGSSRRRAIPGTRQAQRDEKGLIYWTTCTVAECRPKRVFAFAVRSRPFGLPIGPHDTVQLTWRYELTPNAVGAADVTESFQLAQIPAMRLYWRLLGWIRRPRMERDMARTLAAIQAVVER